jgi:hypothetical protein
VTAARIQGIAGGVKPQTLIRVLAGICAALGLICGGLAVAYGRQVAHVRCVETWANYGLSPPEGKCPPAP